MQNKNNERQEKTPPKYNKNNKYRHKGVEFMKKNLNKTTTTSKHDKQQKYNSENTTLRKRTVKELFKR